MKQLIITSVLAVLSIELASAQSGRFSIKGSVDNIQAPAKIILQYSSGDKRIADTADLVNGSFTFAGEISKPVSATMYLLKEADPAKRRNGGERLTIYLDPTDMILAGNTLETATLKGSSSHKDYMILQERLKPDLDQVKLIDEKISKLLPDQKKSTEYEQLWAALAKVYAQMEAIEYKFIGDYPASGVSWNMMLSKFIIMNPTEMQTLNNAFAGALRNSPEGLNLQERINKAFKTDIGQPAPLFTQNNIEGSPVALASLKGKYVLIDFWASWCGPCRAENPYVKEAYDAFKGKNFEVLAISLDDKKENWLKAIQEDELPWIQLSDLSGKENKAAKLYDVIAIPQNWLINPEGIIVAKNLRGKQLHKTLQKFLN